MTRTQIVLALVTVLVAYGVFLVVGAPAAAVAPRLVTAMDGVELVGPSGTLWRGRADDVIVSGVSLGQAEWQVKPLHLLLGSLVARLDLKGGAVVGEGVAGLGVGGAVVEDARIVGDAATLVANTGLLPLGVSGNLALIVDAVRMKDGWPSRLAAEARWDQAGIDWPGLDALGNLTIDLRMEGAELVTNVVNHQEGPFTLTGTVRFTSDGGYATDLTVRTGARTPPNVSQWLSQYASREADGVYVLKQTGTVAELGR